VQFSKILMMQLLSRMGPRSHALSKPSQPMQLRAAAGRRRRSSVSSTGSERADSNSPDCGSEEESVGGHRCEPGRPAQHMHRSQPEDAPSSTGSTNGSGRGNRWRPRPLESLAALLGPGWLEQAAVDALLGVVAFKVGTSRQWAWGLHTYLLWQLSCGMDGRPSVADK
jgi:hypothetical protein